MREQDFAQPEPDSPDGEGAESWSWPEPSPWPDFPAGSEEPSRTRPGPRPRRGTPSGGVWRSTEPDASPSTSTEASDPAERRPGVAARDEPAGADRLAGARSRRDSVSSSAETLPREQRESRRGRTGGGRGISGGDPDSGDPDSDDRSPEPDASAEHLPDRASTSSGSSRKNKRNERAHRPAQEERSSRRERTGKRGAPAEEEQSPEAQARDVVYRLLAVRARSRSELRQALLRKEIDEDIADAVLQKFIDAGLVDDAEFAAAWVQERQRNQGLGRKALGYELRRKGVGEELVNDALSSVDSEAEEERARELVRRKLRTSRADDSTKLLRRMVAMLARKGYPEGLAFRVCKEELENAGLNGGSGELDTP